MEAEAVTNEWMVSKDRLNQKIVRAIAQQTSFAEVRSEPILSDV